MNDDQIKHMVSRFLGWRFPETFSPDAGISFKPDFNENTPWPMKHQPVGTNLFNAAEAEQMVRYMIDGLPQEDRDMSEPLPVLKPREPIATCGLCGRNIYDEDSRCRSQASDNIDVGACPLYGPEWRARQYQRAMTNMWAPVADPSA